MITSQFNSKKCAACRRGVYPFKWVNDILFHVDRRGNVHHKCTNVDYVTQFLTVDYENNIVGVESELTMVMERQALWWGDILLLANNTFPDKTEMEMFFKMGRVGDNITWSDEHLERELRLIAIDRGVSVTKEEYPDLIMYRIISI